MAKTKIVALSAIMALLMIITIAICQSNITPRYQPFEGKAPGYLESNHSSSGAYSSSSTAELAHSRSIMPLANNIMSRAEEIGNLKNFIKIVKAAGRDETLTHYSGPYTIFAPSDESFAKLPENVVNNIIEGSSSNATNILEYLVVNGNYTMDDLESIKSLTNMRGDNLLIDSSNGIKIESAKIISGDVRCSNGIIHVIDTVLRPSPGQDEDGSSRRMDAATLTAQRPVEPDPWLVNPMTYTQPAT